MKTLYNLLRNIMKNVVLSVFLLKNIGCFTLLKLLRISLVSL